MSKNKTKKKDAAKSKSSPKKIAAKKAAPKKAAAKKTAKAPAKAAAKRAPFHHNRLRVLRTAHGINTIDLAKKIKSTKQTVSSAEINTKRIPSEDFIKKVAAFLKVPVTFFSADKVSLSYKGDKLTVEIGK